MGVDTENLVEKIKSGKYNPTADNQVSFTDFTLAEYLNQLLDEKKLSRKEVIKKSLLKQVPTSHIFEGVKFTPINRSYTPAAVIGRQ